MFIFGRMFSKYFCAEVNTEVKVSKFELIYFSFLVQFSAEKFDRPDIVLHSQN